MMNLNSIFTDLDIFLEEPRLRRLYIYTRTIFNAQSAIGHNWEHVRRDVINAAYIGIKENADMNIVMPAIILHDIGYVLYPTDPHGHAENGARECLPLLNEWSEPDRLLISECIRRHKGRYPGYEHMEPRSLEEKVVCDADQIDKFGWTGLVQVLKVYIEYGENGITKYKNMEQLGEGLGHLNSIYLYTDTARLIASTYKEPDWAHISKKLSEEHKTYAEWNDPV